MAKKKNLDQRKLENKRRENGDEWDDIDEHERDVFDKDGYFDVMETEATISASDQKLLQKFSKKEQEESEVGQGKSLADLIMSKMQTGDFEDGNANKEQTNIIDNLDPKIVSSYKKVGIVMKTFRSGKLPKAFKCIPYLQNWEEFLYMTNPSSWSPQATFEATKIFASNLNANMAQRFYSLVLLDIVRGNIFKYKKLNCHLYMAVKKAMFK